MRRKNEGKDRNGTPSPTAFTSSFKAGAIALVFLFLGFELALFVREAAVDIIVAHRDAPDTVFVYRAEAPAEAPCAEVPLAPKIRGNVAKGTSAPGAAPASQIRGNAAKGASAPGAAPASQNRGNAAKEAPFAKAPAAPKNKGNASKGTSAPGAAPASQIRGNAAKEAPFAKAPVAPKNKGNASKGASAPGAAAAAQERDGVRRKDAEHTGKAASLYEQRRGRRVENFRFDPNTVSGPDLQRLGFSEKQAASILSYRSKGGRFHRKEDFARSYVVADSVYARLEAFIDIPLLDINAADSAAFDALPGIGGWFASKMVEYRERIGGYSSSEQLLEIYNFGVERYDGLKDLIFVGPWH